MAGINYAVTSNWGSGFVAEMTVPGGSQGLHGWTIEFDADFDISSIWGATIVSHVGDHYVISNADWNANVAAGSQASFGFQATTGAGGTAMSGLTLDSAGVTPPPPPPPLPALSIADASVSEGNTGTTQLSFAVTLSQAATAPVTVHYATANGTATAGSDYSAQSGTLTFAAGEASKTIVVPVVGDTTVEANETLTVALSTPSGATIAQASATGTIVNDDAQAPPPAGGASLDYSIVSNWGTGLHGGDESRRRQQRVARLDSGLRQHNHDRQYLGRRHREPCRQPLCRGQCRVERRGRPRRHRQLRLPGQRGRRRHHGHQLHGQ